MPRKVIATQEDWRAVRDQFPKSSDDRKFVSEFQFDQTSVVRRTNVTVRDALTNAPTTGSRWVIFEQAITDGATVEEVNRRAREVASASSMPRRDADVFNALRTGYAVLEAGNGARLLAEDGAGVGSRVAAQSKFTSEDLVIGRVYTRKDLAEQFGITDATLNTGVFRPQGSASVWLFVTEDKTADRTQYLDHLDGDVLRWQGQTSGRTDDIIIEHEARGIELLLFYRREKYEHEGAGFRYEGPFRYVDHHGSGPTGFVLRRVFDDVARAAEEAETGGGFDPTSVEDARKRTLAAIVQRQGQTAFRNALLKAYGGRCAITGCDVAEALEAAHIHPYQGDATNHVANGLLLRSDLHTIFDLGLLTVHADTMTVVVAGRLKSSAYGVHHGKQIQLPAAPAERPSGAALKLHARECGLVEGYPKDGETMIDRVESVLSQLGTLQRPGGHFREVSLGQGRLLAVDVFSSGAERGHVRVHLHGTIMRPTSPPPVVPSSTMSGCSACRDAPGESYPCSYKGPQGTREYFGFQWHADDVDLGAIEVAARWLAKG